MRIRAWRGVHYYRVHWLGKANWITYTPVIPGNLFIALVRINFPLSCSTKKSFQFLRLKIELLRLIAWDKKVPVWSNMVFKPQEECQLAPLPSGHVPECCSTTDILDQNRALLQGHAGLKLQVMPGKCMQLTWPCSQILWELNWERPCCHRLN